MMRTVDERQKHLKQGKPDTDDYLLYDFVFYMNCADKANPYRSRFYGCLDCGLKRKLTVNEGERSYWS